MDASGLIHHNWIEIRRNIFLYIHTIPFRAAMKRQSLNSWKAASELLGFELEQCCPVGYELENIKFHTNIEEAISKPYVY